jgi:hypothetical protein
MPKTDYVGIDYGLGKTNIDHETGIRFGVINADEISGEMFPDFVADYGEPTCPKCGGNVSDDTDVKDYHCNDCNLNLDSWECFPEEPWAFFLTPHAGDKEVYKAHCTNDSNRDIFIEKSPYFTYAQYCSPCAPGACYLMNWLEDTEDRYKLRGPGPKAYCFGHDWFEDGKAPYPVYCVKTGNLVEHK